MQPIPSDWATAWHDISRLLIAYLLALPVGWYRETEAHSVGVRTFPLVAMASCGYVLLSATLYHNTVEAQSRVIQGMVAGIGFIGGGAIMRDRANVHGTAAAASIWNTGVIGAAVAEDRLILAACLAAVNLLTLQVLLPLKMKLDARRKSRIHPRVSID
jgi:putative Mg2+ transporter-C (MgtC) family protein